MNAIVIVVILALAAVVLFLLKRSWDQLSSGDLGFALTPAVVGLFIIARWYDQTLPIVLGLVLLLVAVYSAYRLYRGYYEGKEPAERA